jgi:hypothetical protein
MKTNELLARKKDISSSSSRWRAHLREERVPLQLVGDSGYLPTN